MRERRRSRGSLFLMELILVILFFSISAAVCLQVFASARQTASRGHDLSCAVLAAQSAAACWQAAGGDLAAAAELLEGEIQGDRLLVGYDADWQPTTQTKPQYQLTLTREGLYARIEVAKTVAAEPIYSLRARIPGGAE